MGVALAVAADMVVVVVAADLADGFNIDKVRAFA